MIQVSTTMALLASLSVVSCGSTQQHDTAEDGGAASQCARRSGSYLKHSTKQNGTCWEVPDAIVNFDIPGEKGAFDDTRLECGGSTDTTSCVVDVAKACTREEHGDEVLDIAFVKWLADASQGSGTETISIKFPHQAGMNDQMEICSGTYEITYSRP
jgi:hypothetical protein